MGCGESLEKVEGEGKAKGKGLSCTEVLQQKSNFLTRNAWVLESGYERLPYTSGVFTCMRHGIAPKSQTTALEGTFECACDERLPEPRVRLFECDDCPLPLTTRGVHHLLCSRTTFNSSLTLRKVSGTSDQPRQHPHLIKSPTTRPRMDPSIGSLAHGCVASANLNPAEPG